MTGTFGSIDLETGVYSAINTIGTGSGFDAGGTYVSVPFADIDGMHFDPLTGVLYAACGCPADPTS